MENEVGTMVIGAAIRIHRGLGPGLLESVYEVVLARELERLELTVERQVPIAINYEDFTFKEGFRADLVVNGLVIVELKSMEATSSLQKKQLLSYLKLSNMKLGYLLNFGAEMMKDGILRIINGTLP